MKNYVKLFVVFIFSVGCSNDNQSNQSLNVVIQSDLQSHISAINEVEKQSGITVNKLIVPSKDIENVLLSNPNVDAVFVSDDHSIKSNPELFSKIQSRDSIGASPAILAIKKDYALHWGWVDHPEEISWSDVLEKFQEHNLKFAMANPESSTDAFVSLLQLNTVFDVFSSSSIHDDDYLYQLKTFFESQIIVSGDSYHLAEVYLGQEDRLDAIFSNEASLIELNKKTKKDLFFVYPKEGVIFEEYPFILLNGSKAPAYEKLVQFFTGANFQRWQVQKTFIRPINADVPLTADFQKDSTAFSLPAYYTAENIEQYLANYFYVLKKPSYIFYVLDNSGSMIGNRLKLLKSAITSLVDVNSGQFSRFLPKEVVNLITFDSKTNTNKAVEISDKGTELVEFTKMIDAMDARGGAAGYEALYTALGMVKERIANDANHFYSIVFYMDGPSNEGKTIADVQEYFNQYQYEFRNLRIFTVIDNDAPIKEAESLAAMSKGKVFDSHNKSLTSVLKEIKGYQ